jgi:hypothetical protein
MAINPTGKIGPKALARQAARAKAERKLTPGTVALEVRATRAASFNRAGRAFTREPTRVEVADLSPEQLANLLRSGRLELSVTEIAGDAPTNMAAATDTTLKSRPK